MVEKANEKEEGFYKKYMRVMGKIGDIQGRGILTILYFTVFLIPGILLATFGDKLKLKEKPTNWMDKNFKLSMEEMRRQ